MGPGARSLYKWRISYSYKAGCEQQETLYSAPINCFFFFFLNTWPRNIGIIPSLSVSFIYFFFEVSSWKKKSYHLGSCSPQRPPRLSPAQTDPLLASPHLAPCFSFPSLLRVMVFLIPSSSFTNSSFSLRSELDTPSSALYWFLPTGSQLTSCLPCFPHFPLRLFVAAGPAFSHLYSNWPTPPFCQDPAEKIDEKKSLCCQFRAVLAQPVTIQSWNCQEFVHWNAFSLDRISRK